MDTLTDEQRSMLMMIDMAHDFALRGFRAMEAEHGEMLVAAAEAIREGRGRLRLVVEFDPARPAVAVELVGHGADGQPLTAELFRFGEPPQALN